MNKYIIIFLLFLLGGVNIFAQKVSNISFRQDQSNIVVSYDLETTIPCNVELYISTNGGKIWQGPLKQVAGDVGDKISGGSKKIKWYVLEEFDELRGNNILFEVRSNNSDEVDISKSDFYFQSATAKENSKDYIGSIFDYTKSIEYNPTYNYIYLTYEHRARCKFELKDYKGAIADFSSAIKLKPNNEFYYNIRGNAKYNINDFRGAIQDYSTAISLDPNDGEYYFNRGDAKIKIKDKIGGCKDLRKAWELGYNEAYLLLNKYCN